MFSPRHEDLSTASNLRLPFKKKIAGKTLNPLFVGLKKLDLLSLFLLRQRFPANFPQVFGFVLTYLALLQV